MLDESDEIAETSYWPSVGDLFMTLFIISLVLLVVTTYAYLPVSHFDNTASVVEAVGGLQLDKIRQPTNLMRQKLDLPEIHAGDAPKVVIAGLQQTASRVLDELKVIKIGKDADQLADELRQALRRLSEREADVTQLKAELEQMKTAVTGLQLDNAGLRTALNDKPPIIKIAEAGSEGKEEYRFESGNARVGDKFRSALTEGGFRILADEISKRSNTVDTLEIIGHTDGVAVGRRGNLDTLLPSFLAGNRTDLKRLTPGSNNDLGLLRALAIKAEWQEFATSQTNRTLLEAIEVRCYSAGQTVPDGVPASDASRLDAALYRSESEKSRRIEIRLTKLR